MADDEDDDDDLCAAVVVVLRGVRRGATHEVTGCADAMDARREVEINARRKAAQMVVPATIRTRPRRRCTFLGEG